MLYKISFLSVVFLSLINCSSQTATNPDNSAPIEVSQSGEITLKAGESKMIKDSGITITFKSVSQDSRCPEGVNCVWAGVATVEIEVTGRATRPLTLQLSTMDNESKGYKTYVNYSGYNISLIDLTPETTSQKGFKALQGQYKVGLKIEKGTGSAEVQQRGGATTK